MRVEAVQLVLVTRGIHNVSPLPFRHARPQTAKQPAKTQNSTSSWPQLCLWHTDRPHPVVPVDAAMRLGWVHDINADKAISL